MKGSIWTMEPHSWFSNEQSYESDKKVKNSYVVLQWQVLFELPIQQA